MMVRRLLAGLALLGWTVPGIASATPATGARSPAPHAVRAPSAKPSGSALPRRPPQPSPAQLTQARAEFDAFAAGAIERSRYSEYANTQLSPTIVTQVGALLKSLGTVKSFVPLPTESYQGMTIYEFVATCANGSIDELISWDRSGKIQLVYFRQPQ